MKLKPTYATIAIFMIMLITTGFTIGFLYGFFRLGITWPMIIALSLGATAGILAFALLMEKRLPRSYQVAIVGFPKSGKTTLLTSLFGEVFARRISGVKATPRGKTTIERINRDLAKLAQGRTLGPTTDQDLFAYRTDLTIESFPFSSTYKVEFGDFPGRDSQEYSQKYGEWFHTTEFFKWVAESNAVLFVVDLAIYLRQKNLSTAYVAEISKAIRAAWQHLLDYERRREKEVRKQPIVLVFTKADLFNISPKPAVTDAVEKYIVKLGFGDKAPKIHEIHESDLAQGKQSARHDFSDLIEYLSMESVSFSVLFTSSFGTVKGVRLGIGELLKLVLPR